MNSPSLESGHARNETLRRISELILQLNEHEAQFGRGGTLFRTLASVMISEIDKTDSGETESFASDDHPYVNISPDAHKVSPARESVEKMRQEYSSELALVGLRIDDTVGDSWLSAHTDLGKKTLGFMEQYDPAQLEDASSYEAQMVRNYTEDARTADAGITTISKLEINISDPKAFIAFLETVSMLSAEDAVVLESIMTRFLSQIKNDYNILEGIPDDRAVILLGNFGKIISEYKRIGGCSKSIMEDAEHLLKAMKSKCLKEYILVQNSGYVDPLGKGFGPAIWHTDATTEIYRTLWNGVLTLLQDLKGNPKAKDILTQLVTTLHDRIAYAREDMRAREASPQVGSERARSEYPEYRKTLDAVENTLKTMQ